jgi:two-component system CheB/CheR fusion protein
MDMARLEAAQDPRCIEPFDAGQVLSELCATSQPLAAARGLFLKADGPGSLLVEGDLIKTRRIAQNLLLNALKYTTNGGVTVTWKEQEGDHLLLCVQDSGPGLEQEETDEHYQAQGEGVGLSIVKRLCELLDAKIEVESKAGVGTTFQILFPLHYSIKPSGIRPSGT